MHLVAIANQKGGVGKTTSTLNIGGALAQLKQKTLLVDLDPQAHLTIALGYNPLDLDKKQSTILEVLRGDKAPEEVMLKKGNLTILPSSLRLSAAENELHSEPGKEFLLQEALSRLKGFDFVLIDCPPNLALLTVNALVAARHLVIVTQPEYLSTTGIEQLLTSALVIRRRLNKKLEVAGMIITQYNDQLVLHNEVIEMLKGNFKDYLFKTKIRRNVNIPEAQAKGLTIFEYKPKSPGAEDYLNVTQELLAKVATVKKKRK